MGRGHDHHGRGRSIGATLNGDRARAVRLRPNRTRGPGRNRRCARSLLSIIGGLLLAETTIPPASHRDITVIGASAGGIIALRKLLAALPADYRAAVFVVVHLAPDSPSLLAELLDRAGPLPAVQAQDAMPIARGRILVAPPDHHLLLDEDRVRLSHGPRENRHRPSIDVLFRSAAVTFGARVTGVVLSGMLDDGAAGLWAIKRRGGVAVVQDPEDAEFPDMPRNALQAVDVDHCVPVAAMSTRLVELARSTVSNSGQAVPRQMAREVGMAARNDSQMEDLDALGKRTPLTCPECGGSLWELDGEGLRLRCHVGHAYSAQTLASEQSVRVEAALWAALRSLEESERLAKRLAEAASKRGVGQSSNFHEDRARASAAHAEVLRRLLAEAPSTAATERQSAAGRSR